MRVRLAATLVAMTWLLAGTQGRTQARPAAPGRAPLAADRMAAPGPGWRLDQCMAGLTYGAPLRWAVAYGMGLVREYEASNVCLMATAKLGIGGAAAHLGMANAFGMFGGGTAVSVGMLRTFARPRDALARRTYVGASIHAWPVLALGGEFGWYTRVGADPPGVTTPRRLLVWSTGFGF